MSSFMNVFGITSSIFDVLTFLMMWFLLGYNTVLKANFFQTGWFVEGLISQIIIVQFIRTAKRPIIQSHCDIRLALASALGIVAALTIPFVFDGLPSSVFTALPPIYFLYLLLILVLYCVTIEVIKYFYIRHYKTWL